MSCLGGTREEPRDWVRISPDGEETPMTGRFACNVVGPRTSRRKCSGCPAYRGIRRDGSTATGLAPDGTPYALRPAELEQYRAALEAALVDDDFDGIAAFEARMTEGIGDRTLLQLGDPGALDRLASRVRGWRSRNRDRAKALNAAHNRAYRARRKAKLQAVSNDPLQTPTAALSSARAGGGGARTRRTVVTHAGGSNGS